MSTREWSIGVAKKRPVGRFFALCRYLWPDGQSRGRSFAGVGMSSTFFLFVDSAEIEDNNSERTRRKGTHMETPEQSEKGKGLFGLSLAGGGLKSFAQLAALHNLEKHHVKIDAVAGTSLGAVVAALMASGLTTSKIEETLLDAQREFADRGVLSRPAYPLFQHVREHNNGFVELQSLQQMACQLFGKIGCRMLSDCQLPVAITTVDIHTSELIVFTNKPEFFTSPIGDWSSTLGISNWELP